MTIQAAISRGTVGGRWAALAGGIAGAVLCAWGLSRGETEAFYRGYLFAWMVCLGLAMGGMAIVLLHNLTGGAWGDAQRAIGITAGRTLPLLAVMFIPIVLGMHALYPWARGEGGELTAHRHTYLNEGFVIGRAVAYFVLWWGISMLVRRAPKGWTASGGSALGLVIYLLTMTNAGIDWVMSRDTPFYSTTFGFILTVGQTLFALSFGIIILGVRKQRSTEKGVLNDVGNIVLTLVILWAYVSFMQLLVIWMGNSGEDNTWYLRRGIGELLAAQGWKWVGLALVVFHFFVPFYLLLFRGTKQYAPALVAVAWMLFLSHVLEQYWLIVPASDEARPHWLDAAALMGVGGLWLAAFLWLLPRSEKAVLS
jgi:hypothetical protein